MEEADVLCDRVALMHLGVLRAEGSPAALRSELGPGATLDDVFRHYTGAVLDGDTETGGGILETRRTRRTAGRVG
jgi:ABC-2 type transport system ATP-binding protein